MDNEADYSMCSFGPARGDQTLLFFEVSFCSFGLFRGEGGQESAPLSTSVTDKITIPEVTLATEASVLQLNA